jgi:hypothetical protein
MSADHTDAAVVERDGAESGSAPLVDTQNVSQQRVFAREVVENLPPGSGIKNYATMVPGAVYAGGGRPIRTSAGTRILLS